MILRRVWEKQRSILDWVLSASGILDILVYLILEIGALKK